MRAGKLARLLPMVVAALTVPACGGRDAARVEVREDVAVAGRRVSVRLLLLPDHVSQAPRYLSAVRLTLGDYDRRFGPSRRQTLTVIEGQEERDGQDGVVVRLPLIAPALAMEPETEITKAVGLQLWRDRLSCSSSANSFIEGLNRYTAMTTVALQFRVQQTPPAFAYAHPRFFGQFIPWVPRVALQTATVGNGLDEYRANPSDGVARTALAMGTLERWVGAPTWDAVLADFGARAWPSCPGPDDLARAADEVSGLDLSWFFQQVFRSSAVFDYGVDRFVSEPVPAGGAFRTTLVAARFGEAEFTGSSAPRSGGFESGRGIEILVRFADGTVQRETWDGRDRRKTFEYDSQSSAETVEIDPRRVLLLDVNRTNNTMSRSAAGTGRAATKWAGRWMVWFEELLLTYTSL